HRVAWRRVGRLARRRLIPPPPGAPHRRWGAPRTPRPLSAHRAPMTSACPAPRDLIDAEQLRQRGSLKWTALPVEIAAWVAEADFGTAPAVVAAVREGVEAGAFGYLPPSERRALAEACSAWHADRYGWEV